MRHYPFHVGDYAAHTGHLSLLEDLAYRRLLDLYYIAEGPLPKSVEECAKKIRMREHTDEVRAVLEEFFEQTEEGWHSKRCEKEIEDFRRISKAGKTGANARWDRERERRAKTQCDGEEYRDAHQGAGQCEFGTSAMRHQYDRNASEMRPHCESDATVLRIACDRNATPDEVAIATNTQYPIPITQDNPPIVPPEGGRVGLPEPRAGPEIQAPPQKRKSKKPEWFCEVEKPGDVSHQTWDDYCRHRKDKGVPITQTSMNLARREADKADITIEKALAITVGMGWKGFLATYYESRQGAGARRCQLPPGVI